MSRESILISQCRDLRLSNSRFKNYNYPARSITAIAIIMPLVLIAATSGEDESGEIDYSTSPYDTLAAVIFVIGAVIAYILSKKASKFKLRDNQKWAIKVLNIYENLNEYEREDSPEDYLQKAKESITDLISDIQSKIDNTDDKVQWIIPFVNPIDELVRILDNDVYPLIDSKDKTKIPYLKTYLLKLMKYFLGPNDSLLQELVLENIPTSDKEIDEEITISKRPLPFRNFGVFGIFAGIGIALYLLATTNDIDKNSALLASVTLTSALSGGYFAYLKK